MVRSSYFINPTFIWVRLAQCIPVSLHITHAPPGVLVSAGMTYTVVMKEGAAPEIRAVRNSRALATFQQSTHPFIRCGGRRKVQSL
jgi:multidrug resistance efflux pump